MNPIRLTIITICYNDRVGFERTAKSIIDQSYQRFEWIIVDGASTDGSVDSIKSTVESLRECESPIILHWKSEPDKGIYNAMNKGISQAHGQYCLFMNSGDYFYTNDVVEKVLPLLKGIDIYIGDIYHSDEIGVHQFQNSDFTIEGTLNRLASLSYPHQGSFIKTDLLNRFGGYREDLRIVSDWYFYYNAIIYNMATIEFIPMVIAVFDRNGVSSNAGLKLKEERDKSLSGNPYLFLLYDFYSQNYRMLSIIKKSKIGFFIYRIAFYFARKTNR